MINKVFPDQQVFLTTAIGKIRMPLHCPNESFERHIDRLDLSFFRPRHHFEQRRQLLDLPLAASADRQFTHMQQIGKRSAGFDLYNMRRHAERNIGICHDLLIEGAS